MLHVALGDGREYPIHVGAGLLSRAGDLLAPHARGGRAVVVTQPRIAALWGEPLLCALRGAGLQVDLVPFAAGERLKTLATVARLYDALYNLRVDRRALIVALGGGVVGDVAGFLAATYLRGLDCVQVPTTLLAMVDSSVGGKTGVDFRDGKNLVGAFHQPRAVLADTDTLRTLPRREMHSGMAEVVKYGVIRDPNLFRLVTDHADALRNRDSEALSQVIARSCALKAEVVAGDEREESGLRAILNFGHTIGHALEAATRYRRYRHGEAVAIGMVAAACIGEAAGITPAETRQSLAQALQVQRLPISLPGDVPAEMLRNIAARDKKAEGGRLRFVLARALGSVELFSEVDENALREGLALQRREYGEAGVSEKSS